MRAAVVPILCAAAIAPPGCSKKTGSQYSTLGLARPVTVRLLHAGKAPRRVLRYQFGRSGARTLLLDASTGIAGGDGRRGDPAVGFPKLRLPVHLRRHQVTKGGTLRLRFALGSVKLLDPAGLPAETVAPFRRALGRVRGVSGRMTISSTGRPSGVSIRLPHTLPGHVRKTIHSAMQQLLLPVAPLPVKAVGVGARWDVTVALRLVGMQVEQVHSFELTALNGDVGTYRLQVRQQGVAQTLKASGKIGPPLKAIATHGRGAGRIALDRFAPRWKVRAQVSHRMGAKVDGKPFDLALTLRTDAELRPK